MWISHPVGQMVEPRATIGLATVPVVEFFHLRYEGGSRSNPDDYGFLTAHMIRDPDDELLGTALGNRRFTQIHLQHYRTPSTQQSVFSSWIARSLVTEIYLTPRSHLEDFPWVCKLWQYSVLTTE